MVHFQSHQDIRFLEPKSEHLRVFDLIIKYLNKGFPNDFSFPFRIRYALQFPRNNLPAFATFNFLGNVIIEKLNDFITLVLPKQTIINEN